LEEEITRAVLVALIQDKSIIGLLVVDIREYLIEEKGIQLRRIDPEEMSKKLSFQHYNGILSETPRSVNQIINGR